MDKNQDLEDESYLTTKTESSIELKGLEAALWYAEHRSGANRSFFVFLLSIAAILTAFTLIAFSGLLFGSSSINRSISNILNQDLLIKNKLTEVRPEMMLERIAYLSQADQSTVLYQAQNPSTEYVLRFEAVFFDKKDEVGRKHYEIWPREQKYISWSGVMLADGLDMRIENETWTLPDARKYGDWQSFLGERLSLLVSNKHIGSTVKLSQNDNLEAISFDIKNPGAYKIENVNLQIPLFNRGTLVSYYEYHIGDLAAGQSRMITLSLAGHNRSIDDFEVKPDLNIPPNL